MKTTGVEVWVSSSVEISDKNTQRSEILHSNIKKKTVYRVCYPEQHSIWVIWQVFIEFKAIIICICITSPKHSL